MELSLQRMKEARSLKATIGEVIFADLLSIGYSEEDAYAVAYPMDAALSIRMRKTNRESIVRTPRFRILCDERRKKNETYLSVPHTSKDLDLISAEDVAKEILMSAKAQPVGSKERADLMAKYNDIRKDNEQVVENVTDAIHFYLPVKCHQCPLFTAYNLWKAEKGKKELQPVEMDGIIREGDKIIKRILKKNESIEEQD